MKTTENITLTNRRQLAPIKTIVDKAIEEKEIEKTIFLLTYIYLII